MKDKDYTIILIDADKEYEKNSISFEEKNFQ